MDKRKGQFIGYLYHKAMLFINKREGLFIDYLYHKAMLFMGKREGLFIAYQYLSILATINHPYWWLHLIACKRQLI